MVKSKKNRSHHVCESCENKFNIKNNQKIKREKRAYVLIVSGGLLAFFLMMGSFFIFPMDVPKLVRFALGAPGLGIFIWGMNRPRYKILTCPKCGLQTKKALKDVKNNLLDLPYDRSDLRRDLSDTGNDLS